MPDAVEQPSKDHLLLRAARGERTDRTPVWLMRQAGRFDPAYRVVRERVDLALEDIFLDADLATEISLLPRRFGVDAIIIFQDILTPLAPMGARFRFRPGPVLASPVRTAGDVAALKPIDPAIRLSFVADTIKKVRRELDGQLPVLGFAGAPLTLAAFLIEGASPANGVPHTRSMIDTDPALFHQLLDLLADMTGDYLSMQVHAGADAVQVFESFADLFSEREYEKFALPYHVRIFERLPAGTPAILFARDFPHCDLLARSGASVLSVGSAIDLAGAKHQLGGRVALQGNIDPQLLLSGSFEEIDQAVTACVRVGAHQGHILNLGHGVLKDTPVENVCRLIETCKQTRMDGEAGWPTSPEVEHPMIECGNTTTTKP